jgi:hypothetical protein
MALSPTPTAVDNRSLLEAMLGDGRFLIALTGMALLASGIFAIAQSITGQLLPHDVQALGMDAAVLRQHANGNLVRFMFHDRVAFGGTLISIGLAYWWPAEFPLALRAAWAWWTLAISGTTGFLSFLAYLGYGYLDTWHGVATLLLLPVYIAGMWRARSRLLPGLNVRCIWKFERGSEARAVSLGRNILLFIGAGLIAAGTTILVVGMSFVFVPQDLAFIGLSAAKIHSVSPVLVPLIAHDRAGFGGGLLSFGLLLLLLMRHAPLTRSLVELIAAMGFCGFGCAVGVHFAIGYIDFTHLLPAYLGILLFIAGTLLFASGLRNSKAFKTAA